MSDIVIRAEGLGKHYRLAPTRPDTMLREAIVSGITRGVRRIARLGRGEPEEAFWALRDVSFEIARGEAVGIIGGNGAGKSTLLKLLSRITEPTTGRASIRGRVGSLLEVGTGFHPELSGRENIFLNGAVLGMKRHEVVRKFDEIVAFAEVERFIDTPVKHYSSGMYLRLAFAVAAHLEPEVLIVDEVLAVGDAQFQKKCLGRMDEVAREGRTVLFVSHNLDAVRRLCTRAILLDQGRVALEGSAREVASHYVARTVAVDQPQQWCDVSGLPRRGSGEAQIGAIRFGVPGGSEAMPHPDGAFEVWLRIESSLSMNVRCLSLMIWDVYGTKLVNAEIATEGKHLDLRPGGTVVRFLIDRLHLNPGVYTLGCWIGQRIEDENPLDFVESAVSFEVVDHRTDGFLYDWAVGPVTCSFSFAPEGECSLRPAMEVQVIGASND